MKISVTFSTVYPLNKLHGKTESGRDIYQIKEIIWCWIQINGRMFLVLIPLNFLSDGQSIPRFLWWLYPPTQGRCFVVAVLHDYLYQTKYFDRWVCDAIFEAGIKSLGAGLVEQEIKHTTLRWFGWKAWNDKSIENVKKIRMMSDIKLERIPLFKIK